MLVTAAGGVMRIAGAVQAPAADNPGSPPPQLHPTMKDDRMVFRAVPIRGRLSLGSARVGLKRNAGLVLGLIALACVWLLREPLQEKVWLWSTLANDAPSVEAVETTVQQASDPWDAWLRLWHSGNLVHRQAEISLVPRMAPSGQPLPEPVERVVLAGTLDADFNVREQALAWVWSMKHPLRESLAAIQLTDADPEIRLLGLRYLRRFDPRTWIPVVASLLDDPDPLVLAMGLKLWERWSGSDFGVRVRDAVTTEQTDPLDPVNDSDGLARLHAARARAAAWWEAHRARYSGSPLLVPDDLYRAVRPVPAPDFRLRTLEGLQVRLRDLRGKTVVLNFWTTWRPACVGEIQSLKLLRQRHGPELVILGISLDALADDHGHAHPARVLPNAPEGEVTPPHSHDEKAAGTAAEAIRAKVERVVRAREINYPVLIDSDNRAGAAYNGGELPTTVVVDPRGTVRRRFVGKRSPATLERFVAEAGQPRFAAVASSESGIRSSPPASYKR